MATKILKGKFLPQYRTAAQWSAANPVLLAGEIGIESDTRKFKFGDGATAWNSLGYAGSGGDSAERLSGALEITDFADFPDTTVFEKPGDIVPIRVDVGDNSPNESSGLFVGTAQAWERWVSGGAENQIVYSVIDTVSGKAYSGRTTGAGGSIQWVESGGGVNGLLGSVKSLTTSFWNLISSNVSDIQAFVIRENSPEVPAEYKGEGFGFAKYYRDDVGMASVTMKLNSGSVKTFNVTFYGDGSDTSWEEAGGASSAQNNLPFDGPIPGYKNVLSESYVDCILTNGGTTAVSLKEKPAQNSWCFVEAEVVTTDNVVKTSSALMLFRFKQAAVICDINSLAISKSTTAVGSVKLNIGTINTSSLVVALTCSNLGSDLLNGYLRIRGFYTKQL